ncbi:MAG: substrate-binding domain-containing protein [Bdellovibrionaceae bacterium]|nr:substrate-binding domain-containing protein [Pseudobdellovibrionaceae bacterium]
MKKLVFSALVFAAATASAQNKVLFAGSDTLGGMMTDAIIAAGMDSQIQYTGGGSGLAEKGLANGDQNIGPMSREIKPEVLNEMKARGLDVVPHVIGLDGIALFVKASSPVQALDLPTVTRIFTCEITQWEQIPGSNLRGQIRVVRRNDASGTTDAFKHFTGLKNFGACVTVLNETADIAEATARDGLTIGYAGLSGKLADNRTLAIAKSAGAAPVLPNTTSIRNFSYPMARNLYVYEVIGRELSQPEADLMSYVTDRSFMDPIVQSHEFITID